MTDRGLGAAISVEARKATASRVLLGTATLLIVGVAALATVTAVAGAGGNEQLAAKLGPLAAQGGWPGVLAIAYQVTAAAGMLAFGVGLSWLYGREFAEGTITGLFALPVRRPTMALAKLLVYLLWTVGTAVVLTLMVGVCAAATSQQAPDSAAAAGLARLFGLTVLTALLPVPAAWAATLGRGLLPAIATTVALMAISQILASAGTGAWFPFVAPALWAIMPGSVSPVQLLAVVAVPVIFGILTLWTWNRLELDR